MLKRIINKIDFLLGTTIIFSILSIFFFSCKFPVKLASPKSESTIIDYPSEGTGESPVLKENEIRNDNSIIKTEKKVIAENIYTGTTAVIIGCCSMAIIFLVAIGLFIKWYKTDNMLNFITKAINNSDIETQNRFKKAVNHLHKEGQYSEYTKRYDNEKINLSKYVRKNKTHV